MILVDANVLIDVAVERFPHSVASSEFLARLDSGDEPGAVAWHTVATVYYVVAKARGHAAARAFVIRVSEFLSIAPTDHTSFQYATSLPMSDFEDAMQVAAAQACGARLIVTRDRDDFEHSPIRAVEPSEALSELS